jgi:carbamoyltransferase
MVILGISAFYHDSAVALVRDGEILYAAQEERFSRKKHDAGFPEKALENCLETIGIAADQLDMAVFYEKPFLKLDRLMDTYMQFAPRGLRSFLKAIPVWTKQKIFIKDIIRQKLNRDDIPVLFALHHESHAASAFYPSPFQEAAILTVDGVGEWDTLTISRGQGHRIQILKKISFPHSLGLLYSAFTYFTGFKVNSGEYKLMGLAPYGEPRYAELILRELVDVKPDGSFRLNLKYFNYHVGLTMTNRKFEKLFNASPRKPETAIRQIDMDLAASIQKVIEDIMDRIIHTTKKVILSDNLCLAGGVALNCVSNGKLLKKQIFKNIWIQPAAGDAGGALGAALYVWHTHLENKRTVGNGRDSQKGSFLGPSYPAEEIKQFLDRNRVKYQQIPHREMSIRVARLLDNQKIIGFFQGKLEFGPRALGSRSIIGDARSETMQSRMNLKIKFRESFRPFAPSLLQEETEKYFDFCRPSPYMLLVYNINDRLRTEPSARDRTRKGLEMLSVKRSELPAITHVDYSARIHTVDRETNPYFYSIIEEFFKLTGCPVIINTSFNVRGEPIVNSPEDAYKCFRRTNMDYLVLENFLVEKQEQEFIHMDENWMKEFPLD